MAVALRAFDQSDLELLKLWLEQPHVAPWYPNPARDLDLAINPPAAGSHAIITSDGIDVGYIRWQHVDRETLDELGLQEIPENSVDIDILIGDVERTGQQVGPAALSLLAATFLPDPHVPLLGLTTSVLNTRAHRAFAKAGFSIVRQYDPNGLGRCHLMTRDLRSERSL